MDAIDRNLERIDVALRRKRFFVAVPAAQPASARLAPQNTLRLVHVPLVGEIESPDLDIRNTADATSEGRGPPSDMNAHSGERSPEDVSNFPDKEISREPRAGFQAFLHKLFGIRRD